MNQISTSYLPPPILFFLFRGISGKNPRDRLQWKGFQVCQIGNFAGILREFLNGQDFGNSRSQKKFPQNSRCFEPLNHCYDCDLPDFIPILVFFIGGGGVISELIPIHHEDPHQHP